MVSVRNSNERVFVTINFLTEKNEPQYGMTATVAMVFFLNFSLYCPMLYLRSSHVVNFSQCVAFQILLLFNYQSLFV